ncbi:MAG: 2-amino-4-hydroxy-6-hydroxymethyldihydropteridine diphosphokinase [Gammaproteobacteria bacterium]|nr:2-amino-4-hydroxy-6-hydroxymethyldihydropteridine diphosphokinase [Gammaproteobacteria bacterium]
MSAPTRRAFVGLGSNLDDPAGQVRRAFTALAALPGTSLAARSRLYRNPPMGPQDQPDYVNAVAALDTTFTAEALLDALQGVERAHGRVRDGTRWGPRTLDLDLLVYADAVIATAGLHVPHPGIAERAFVLVPLAEIAPRLDIPGLGAVADLLEAVDRTSVVPLDAGDGTP